ncbi:hypothetical protein H4W34_006704 [Actinomadura algeriensis]|uniref:Uncharacterized protein n=1 Tax=Actinomadura algeriensis TaxID=1679523 RepID=A0ABR9K1Z4_9ACTN|nr:hypothetical protein [Actinomadura algeriensis]
MNWATSRTRTPPIGLNMVETSVPGIDP